MLHKESDNNFTNELSFTVIYDFIKFKLDLKIQILKKCFFVDSSTLHSEQLSKSSVFLKKKMLSFGIANNFLKNGLIEKYKFRNIDGFENYFEF